MRVDVSTMQILHDTKLWYVDTEQPEFGETTLGSIYLGIEESHYKGKTGYQRNGSRLIFTKRKEALAKFHETWPDRNTVELHLFRTRSMHSEFAYQSIFEIYGTPDGTA